MSKRKLTRKQAWRINKIQEEKAARAEKKASQITNAETEGKLGPEQEGLVTAHYGSQVEVEAHDQPGSGKRCHFRANLGSLVTGDNVIWCDAEPTGVVVAVLPRESELSRPDPHGTMKTIAANIDNIAVVIAPLPKPHSYLIDRYLVAAEAIGIKPVLVINKTDLIDSKNQAVIDDITELYTSLDYDVIRASTTVGNGLDALRTFLKNKTTVFVGQSGVGKSSLINCLLPDQTLRVGALSESSQKGTHTTTTAKLFHFPREDRSDAGRLIDSPGIREFGLWHMDHETLQKGFIEFQPLVGKCKFRNCQHQQEPGCAILQAWEQGDICERRMSSYRLLRENIEL